MLHRHTCSQSAPLHADSDDLGDLRELINHVLDSDVVVLLQSKDVLTRPWCLLELYAAATAGIPIVALACSGKGYDFAAAEDHLLHLDTSLHVANPSAVEVLEANDAPVLRVAHVLWACIPNIISVPLNSSGSENAIRAAVADLVKAMQRARAIPAPSDAEAWLGDREAQDEAALLELIERGTARGSTIRGTQRGRLLQKLERAEELASEVEDLKAELRVERTAHRDQTSEVDDLKAQLRVEQTAHLDTVAAHLDAVAAHRADVAEKDRRITELSNKLINAI